MQKRILAVLAQGIEGEFVALETTYLKSRVGGDRSNLRRAIRGLISRGLVEERHEGGRNYYELTLVGHTLAVPQDPTTAPSLWDFLGLSLKRGNPMDEYERRSKRQPEGRLRVRGHERGKHEAVTQRGVAR